MAKRFIDTDLFKRPRFKELKAPYKLLWVYLMCECNHAGLWNVELDVAGLRIGQKLPEDCASVMGHMIQVVDGGRKWWLKDFVRFQYGQELVTANRMHASVLRELQIWGLEDHLDDVSVVEQGSSVSAVRHRLSKKMKDEVLMRDELTCQYCNTQKPIAELVVDHVLPVTKGGDNSDDNLAACCVRCNSHKSDLTLDEFLSREHKFLDPLERVIKKLKGPFKPLQGAKDKDKDRDKDNSEKKEHASNVQPPAVEPVVIALPFTSEDFATSWAEWETSRRKRGKPISEAARKMQLAKCLEWGEERAIAALKHSTGNDYQGLYEPNNRANHGPASKTIDATNAQIERVSRMLAATRQ